MFVHVYCWCHRRRRVATQTGQNATDRRFWTIAHDTRPMCGNAVFFQRERYLFTKTDTSFACASLAITFASGAQTRQRPIEEEAPILLPTATSIYTHGERHRRAAPRWTSCYTRMMTLRSNTGTCPTPRAKPDLYTCFFTLQ